MEGQGLLRRVRSARVVCERRRGPRSGAAGRAVQHYLPEAGVKADIIAFRDTPLNNSRLFRAREVEFDERRVMFASPEDVILKRLRYFREGESD